jgi:chemotaxis protein CheY-P-specific phosphatase CheC
MSSKKRIDKILTSVNERVKEEIGVLLGVKISLGGARNTLTGKQDFFDSLVGKQILAKIALGGDIEGEGCLVIGIKDAIRLGGTLIMLPDSELEEVVGREEYTDETEDSYGEIANIIAGSYTKVFEEMYSKKFRFVRKEQEIIVPGKVDVASDEPIPDQQYYQVTCAITMEDRQMGEVHMLMPAEPLGLQSEELPPKSAEPAPVAEEPEPEVVAAPEADESPAEEPVAATAGPSGDTSQKKSKFDPVKHRKRIDKMLADCGKKLTEEVSSLLGVNVKFSTPENSYISKEDLFFEELEGKQVIADMEVAGELQGKSYLFLGLKDSIHLGGVLIMLPPNELENVVSDEEFSEDVKDAYGEVANIVSGVYTSVFEEQYTEKIRFVKKTIQQIVPMKVEIDSEEPVENQQYYMSAMSMAVDGNVLGKMRMVFPSALLKIAQADQEESVEAPPAPEEVAAPVAPVETVAANDEETEVVESVRKRAAGFDPVKHRKRVDKLLKECGKTVQKEVSALLGADIQISEIENRLISKEDFFFDVANGKQVMAKMDVVGELEDESYLFFTLKDAIHTGGILIMLPPTELESAVSSEEFNEDSVDAFGEIANIIAGVYTAVFEEQYTDKIRFIKTDLQQVVPMKVDIESDEPCPDLVYYLSSMVLSIEGERQGNINLLLPAAMLQLDEAAQNAAVQDQQDERPEKVEVEAEKAEAAGGGVQKADRQKHVPVDILIISDDEVASAHLAAGAEECGFSIRKVSFKDNIKSAITSELKAIYIVMREVDEKAFGMAIRVSSSSSLPLIAAGPGWTRSKVIKAVKYGVNDILLTPATNDDIKENIENNLLQMAA